MRLGIPEPDHESWSDLLNHTVKVLDFGLAKILDIGQGRVKALTKAGFAPGTAHYMSPEQARGTGDLDYRADLYAVGLLLYRMLTGEEAFPGDNAMEVISLQLGAPTPALPPTHADELNRVVQRATAKNPADRFSSADEMAWAMRCAHNPILRSGPAPALATPPPLSKPSLLRRLFGG
jgi:serine/threonine-protein kinase